MPLLLLEVVHIILKKYEHNADDYEFVKNLFVTQRISIEYRRLPDKIRSETSHFYVERLLFELRKLSTESWIKGLGLMDYDFLKDLILCDQLKIKMPAEMRENVLDNRGKIASSSILVERAEEFEYVRKITRKPASISENIGKSKTPNYT